MTMTKPREMRQVRKVGKRQRMRRRKKRQRDVSGVFVLQAIRQAMHHLPILVVSPGATIIPEEGRGVRQLYVEGRKREISSYVVEKRSESERKRGNERD